MNDKYAELKKKAVPTEIDPTDEILDEIAASRPPEIHGEPKPFLQLMSNKAELRTVFYMMENIILHSIGVDKRREPFKEFPNTAAEWKRRIKICEDWFREARGQLGYSLTQTMDLMPHALRCRLDGIKFNPKDPPKLWVPS
jgi:hypothetical protein